MYTIDINNTLEFDDGKYIVAAAAGNLLRVRSVDTGEYSTVHLADVRRRLRNVPQRLEGDPRELDELHKRINQTEMRVIERKVRHIEEMRYGLPHDAPEGTDPKPEYDPDRTTITRRLEAKSRELGVDKSTLKKWVKAYRQLGWAGLIDHRHHRRQSPLQHMDKPVWDSMMNVIESRTDKSTVPMTRLLELMKADLKMHHPGYDQSSLKDRTLRKWGNFLMEGRYTVGDATARLSAAQTPDRPFGAERPMPGEQVQMDSTVLDNFTVLDDEGTVQRPTLTILLDVATRSILAATIRVGSAKAVDHAFCLAQALVMRQDRPGHREMWELAKTLVPELRSLPPDDIERPFIYPQRIIIDNGLDFRGSTFDAACRKFGISLTYARPNKPIDKPEVERLFGTITRGFLSKLPGYVGNAVKNRGRSPESDNLLNVVLLAEGLDRWITSVYQNNPHDGLRDPMHPHIALSPNQMHAAMASLSGTVQMPLSSEDLIELLPIDHRKITKEGIQINYLKYNSKELQALRHLPSNNKSKNYKWEVRSNPYNPRLIWVRHPEQGWIECKWREDGRFDNPHAVELDRTARRMARQAAVKGQLISADAILEFLMLFGGNASVQKQITRGKLAHELAEREGTPMPTAAPENKPTRRNRRRNGSKRAIRHLEEP
ncbi:helix-turn-helix domain-containing protein [Salinibacterium sp. ZJ450]|uniref:helix-turn-helix domain-containing protein n=1 Tax=Salinibacterium sp. ZJ450 TaxID=2708338 RepID=UPI00141E8A91|nr:helix-turn-helix domain-containing protein [Salinibacterium sp. ZJ450]